MSPLTRSNRLRRNLITGLLLVGFASLGPGA